MGTMRQGELKLLAMQSKSKGNLNMIKNVSNTKANLKGPHLYKAIPSTCTRFISTQNSSHNTITFSQQQMHDVESFVTKLTAELSTMKELVKEMVHGDFCSTPSLKHNIAKVCDYIDLLA